MLTLGVIQTFTSVTTPAVDAVTVTDMLPVLPEAAAVMVAEPAATAEMSPLPDTVATAALDVVHVNEVPDIVAPFASLATAVAWVVPPTASVVVAGVTAIELTVVTVPVTVNPSSPVMPPLVALIFELPGANPLTMPVADTLRIAGFSEMYVIVRPESTLPLASYSVTAVCTDSPTLRSCFGASSTVFATGAASVVLTVIEMEPETVPLRAMTATVPPPTAVMSPFA